MRVFLLFLSIFAGLFDAFASEAEDVAVRQRYKFAIDTPDGGITGMMILACDDGDMTKGSIINEFGFSAIDFTYNRPKHKVKLVNVIKFLDKWQVKYVLRRDLAAIMKMIHGEHLGLGRVYEISNNDDTVMLRNKRRRITYTFTPLP